MAETPTSAALKARVQTVTAATFDDLALDLFRFQAAENPVYGRYLGYLGVNPAAVGRVEQIPFLPLDFFKFHRIQSGSLPVAVTFESSGTTGQTPSRHAVADPAFYLQHSQRLFEARYGPLRDWVVLALLPSYLERGNSSLVYMVRHFIEQSAHPASGFFLHNISDLRRQLKSFSLLPSPFSILLIGVTFALLDLAESGEDWSFLGTLPNLVVMETGGMKGRRRELLREEVHEILTRAFGVPRIHSEYGMTELLSQAYSPGGGVFELPPPMRVLLRDVNDPFSYLRPGGRSTGGINVIDLANVDSCAFLETKDLGSYVGPNQFRVLGRFDNSDIRGCNLMVA
jgi:hypothetical protein